MLLPYLNKDLIEAGCDEAGRGCLAGSVYAAAVILPKDFKNELLNDSKQLTEKQRYALREVIEKEALAWAVGVVSPEEIDEINILRASFLAMHRALGDGPERGQITDDCMLLERAGRRVKLVPGSCRNLKITATRSCSLPESRSMPRPARAAMRSASHTFSSRRI